MRWVNFAASNVLQEAGLDAGFDHGNLTIRNFRIGGQSESDTLLN
ncbi:hypothetical protein [Noviherbaspirillum agri]